MINTKTTILIISILLIIKIGLHLPIILYGMPYAIGNVDENDFIGAALNYGASKTIKSTITWYPAFYSYLLALALGVYYIFLLAFSKITTINDFALHYLLYPGYFHFIGRLLSVILASSSLILIYLCGKNYRNRFVGIFAAFCFTFSNVILDRTAWALPDSTYIFTTILSLYFIIKFKITKKFFHIILAGLFCGLAISTKYNVGVLILVGISAVFLVNNNENEKFWSWKNIKFVFRSPYIYYYLLFVTIGFLCGSPYWLINLSDNLNGLKWEIGRLNVEEFVTNNWLSKLPYVWIFSELVINEHILGIIIIISIFVLIYRALKGDDNSFLFIPYIIVSFILIGKYHKHSIHYFLPVFPILFIIAGEAIYPYIKDKLTKLLILCLLISLLIPLNNMITYSCSHLNKDIRLVASEWIQKNIPFGATIAIGKTSNAPPLPDLLRFEKKLYSSISEQILSNKLSNDIKEQYKFKIENSSYALINYIVKTSYGRSESFSKMLSDIVIEPYNEIQPYHPQFLIYSSLDNVFFQKQGYEDILAVSNYSKEFILCKTFQSKQDESYFIRIYRSRSRH